jgi:hypothetical protein
MRLFLTLLIFSIFTFAGCDTDSKGCQVDYDCEDDKVCRLADGLCEQKICKMNSECEGDDSVCRDNRCLNTCQADVDCGSGFTCVDNACDQ